MIKSDHFVFDPLDRTKRWKDIFDQIDNNFDQVGVYFETIGSRVNVEKFQSINGQTDFSMATKYNTKRNCLAVYVNNSRQWLGTGFIETSDHSFKLTTPVNKTDVVIAVSNDYYTLSDTTTDAFNNLMSELEDYLKIANANATRSEEALLDVQRTKQEFDEDYDEKKAAIDASLEQIEDYLGVMPAYGVCNSDADDPDKIVSLIYTDLWSLKQGMFLVVKFVNGNTAKNITMNVNDSGYIPVYYGGEPVEADLINVDTYLFAYDGTNYDLSGGVGMCTRFYVDVSNRKLVIRNQAGSGSSGGGGGGGDDPYILPTATTRRLGGVKIGTGLSVTSDGTTSTDPDNINAVVDEQYEETAGNDLSESDINTMFDE